MLTTPKRKKECVNYKVIETFEKYETNGAIEIRALELHKKHKFRAIIAMSEYDLLRAGRLRDILKIKGQSFESALAFRDKVIMKKYLQKVGLMVPNFSKVESVIDIYNFIQTHGYPVIIKPIDGMGSIGTIVLRNRRDLMDYLINGLDYNIEIETFIEGEMYHIDGLVLNGEVVHCWPSKYVNGCLAFQDDKVLGSYQLNADNPLTQRLIDYTKNALSALPTPENTSFHAEVFHTTNNKLVFCEIASRTGGGLVRQTIQQGFGFDINQLVVQAQCGLEVTVPYYINGEGPKVQSGWLLIPPKKGLLKEIPKLSFANWVTKQDISAKPGQEFDGSISSVDAIAGFCISGNSEEQLVFRIQELATWFEQSLVWENKLI